MAGVKGKSGRKSKGWSDEDKRLLNALRSAINTRKKKGWKYNGPANINMNTLTESQVRLYFTPDLKLNPLSLSDFFEIPEEEVKKANAKKKKEKEKKKQENLQSVKNRLSNIYDNDLKTNNITELALYSNAKGIITNIDKDLQDIPQNFIKSLKLDSEEKELRLDILRKLGQLSEIFALVGNSENSKQNRVDNAKSNFIDTLEYLKNSSKDNKEFYKKLKNLYKSIPKDAKSTYAWLYSDDDNLKIRGKAEEGN